MPYLKEQFSSTKYGSEAEAKKARNHRAKDETRRVYGRMQKV